MAFIKVFGDFKFSNILIFHNLEDIQKAQFRFGYNLITFKILFNAVF